MASTNQSPFYMRAEKNFLNAQSNEEKLKWLEEMIRECPKHKSAEKMLANLKTRYIKLKERIERSEKVSKGSSKKGIKKEGLQAVIVGKTNSGKSTILSGLTNLKAKVSENLFATTYPLVGMMSYSGVPIQVIEIPAVESEYYDRGLVHTADLVIILVDKISDIAEVSEKIGKLAGKVLVVVNKIDLLDERERRKLDATLKSKKINFVLISSKTGENFELLKEKMFSEFGKVRIYTKEPGKEHSKIPVVFNPGVTVRGVAEKIYKGFSKKISETKIWGPSSKFSGQKVSLGHQLKDLDIVEFRVK